MLTLQHVRLAQYHQSSSRESYSGPPWWNVRLLAGTRGATIFNFTVLFQHTNFRLRAEHLVLVPRVTNPENTFALHHLREGHVNSFPLGYKASFVQPQPLSCPSDLRRGLIARALMQSPHLFQSRW